MPISVVMAFEANKVYMAMSGTFLSEPVQGGSHAYHIFNAAPYDKNEEMRLFSRE